MNDDDGATEESSQQGANEINVSLMITNVWWVVCMVLTSPDSAGALAERTTHPAFSIAWLVL